MKPTLAFVLALCLPLACGPGPKLGETRAWSDHYSFRITPDMVPPRANESVHFRIVVQEKQTGQPIEAGEGGIYAQTQDGAKADDGLKKEREAGTYSARLNFLIGGDWAMGLQFRREKNPKMAMERVNWIQAVVPDTSIGPAGGK